MICNDEKFYASRAQELNKKLSLPHTAGKLVRESQVYQQKFKGMF